LLRFCLAYPKLKFQNFGAEKKTVMICDDEPDQLNLFRKALEPKYNIVLVNSGKDCIDRFIGMKNHGNKVDLLLLDYRLHDVSGESVARRIKEYNATKIILMSAYGIDDSLLQELEESKHIAKYVKKPIKLSSLIQVVDETISDGIS
jgi:CheY-like chemotaxis protein